MSSCIRLPWRRKCRSEPQIPQARVRTSTWPMPGTGSATRSTTSSSARMTTACTSPTAVLAGLAAARHTPEGPSAAKQLGLQPISCLLGPASSHTEAPASPPGGRLGGCGGRRSDLRLGRARLQAARAGPLAASHSRHEGQAGKSGRTQLQREQDLKAWPATAHKGQRGEADGGHQLTDA